MYRHANNSTTCYTIGLLSVSAGKSNQLHVDNFTEHAEKFSHDAANRSLAGDEIRHRLVWENVKGQVVQMPYGFLVFDDTVIDKNFSRNIELVRKQYSGNVQKVIKGVGVVTCVYINPQIDQFWIIDYRIYDPEGTARPSWTMCRTCCSTANVKAVLKLGSSK